MPLTETQIAQFREHGYLNLGRIHNESELAEIGAEYDALVTPEQILGPADAGGFPYRVMLHMLSPRLRRYTAHPGLLEIMMQLIGPDVRLWWDQGINKGPGSGAAVPWHQDNGFTEGSIPEYVTTWLSLDDSSLENGGLYVLPGSHKDGPRDHVGGDDGFYHYVPGVDESRAIALPASAGDVLIFSSLMLHRTVGNTTKDRQRRAWVIQYMQTDVVNSVTGETYEHLPELTRDGRILPLDEIAFAGVS